MTPEINTRIVTSQISTCYNQGTYNTDMIGTKVVAVHVADREWFDEELA